MRSLPERFMPRERIEPNVFENIRETISLNDLILLRQWGKGDCQNKYDFLPNRGFHTISKTDDPSILNQTYKNN